MLELDDIQHFLLTRPAAQVAHYAFVSLSHPEESRSWLAGLIDKVGSGAVPQARQVVDARWVTIAFTWNGLRALGVDEASLSTFPEEFRQGMAARAAVLGDSAPITPTAGSMDCNGRICTPFSSCSPATSRSGSVASTSTSSTRRDSQA